MPALWVKAPHCQLVESFLVSQKELLVLDSSAVEICAVSIPAPHCPPLKTTTYLPLCWLSGARPKPAPGRAAWAGRSGAGLLSVISASSLSEISRHPGKPAVGACVSTLLVWLQVRDVRVDLGETAVLVLRLASRETREST